MPDFVLAAVKMGSKIKSLLSQSPIRCGMIEKLTSNINGISAGGDQWKKKAVGC